MLQKLQLFDNPKWIFNVDETGFPLGEKPGKVIAKKSIKLLVGGSGWQNITVQTHYMYLPHVRHDHQCHHLSSQH